MFNPAGSEITKRLVFNSGSLDFGDDRLVDVDNVAVNIAWTVADIYVLGSIKRADIARSQLKVTLTGTIKSFAPEMENLALGASTPGSPEEISVLDGQASLTNPVLTLFDRNDKEIQYQLVNALFKSVKVNSRVDEYATWDFEIEAIDIVEVFTA